MTRVQSLDIPTVSHGGENDVLFAISDMIKDERRRLTTEVGETMETKFDQMDQRMNDSNLRPLKLSIKMETNDPRKQLYHEHFNHLQTEFEQTINMGNALKMETNEPRKQLYHEHFNHL